MAENATSSIVTLEEFLATDPEAPIRGSEYVDFGSTTNRGVVR